VSLDFLSAVYRHVLSGGINLDSELMLIAAGHFWLFFREFLLDLPKNVFKTGSRTTLVSY
jgi:hypothetical protein